MKFARDIVLFMLLGSSLAATTSKTPTSTKPKVTSTTKLHATSTKKCPSYATTTAAIMCPMIQCMKPRADVTLIPGNGATGGVTLSPNTPINLSTKTVTGGCTITKVVGGPCPSCGGGGITIGEVEPSI